MLKAVTVASARLEHQPFQRRTHPACDAGSGRLIGFMASAGNDIDGLGLLFLRPIQEAVVDIGNYIKSGSSRPPVAMRTLSSKLDNSK